MFPFMFLGLGIGSWFENFLKQWDNENSSVMKNSFLIGNDGFNFIGEYEDFSPKAYLLPKEKLYTIGYGSTRIYNSDGSSSRVVKYGETITKVDAVFQLKMYYNRSGSVKNEIDNIIRKYGIILNQKFYDMLMQCSYASGSFHKKAGFVNIYVNMLKKANMSNDLNMLGDLISGTWISYLKIYANYTINGLGWSRRAYGAKMYILGLNWSKLNSEMQIKKPY
ncbi:glycoside hydrolase family protein [Kaistella sp.]|uniref:glycoside hydrolase family protein n=1 Tax=Kaistella sp. TaxID=2782235 RepID=UPI003C52F0BC